MKKKTGNDKSGQPDQERIAQLAAAVYPVTSATELPANPKIPNSTPRVISREEEAVRIATRLWLHAGEYSEKLKAAIDAPDHNTPWTQPWSVAGDENRADAANTLERWSDPNQTVLTLEHAWDWLRKNAKAKKDKNLSLKGFKAEWEKFGKGPNMMISVKSVHEFIKWRSEQRSLERERRRELQQGKSKKRSAQFRRARG